MNNLLVNPWVVGIGITIIGTVVAGLILYFVFGIGKTNDRQKKAENNPQIGPKKQPETELKKQPNNLTKKPFDKPTPTEIMDYLHNLPPLQREDAASHYKGIKVSWVVSIESSEKKPNGNTSLITQYERHVSPAIFFEIELVKYPELKIINKDQEFKVEGEIDTVMVGGAIKLTNCKLYF
jgi:hypothetical protein